jgi:hypothetical protein
MVKRMFTCSDEGAKPIHQEQKKEGQKKERNK